MSSDFCSVVYEQIVPTGCNSSDSSDAIRICEGMYLYTFDETPIAIFYNLVPQGYAILDYYNGIVLEYSTEYDNPFISDMDERYYYDGVFSYYRSIGSGKFINLATKQEVSASKATVIIAEDFYKDGIVPEKTRAIESEGPVYLTGSTRLYNCNVYDNLSYFYPGFTEQQLQSMPGVCGSVACAILVAYMDDYKPSLAGSGDFAANWRKTSGSFSNNTYGIYLVDEFIGYVEPDGNGSFFLNPGLSSYLSDHGILGGCTLGLISVYIQTKNAILSDGSGNPIIIGTNGHYSIGAGYQNITEKQIYTNTGWGYMAWINASTVISTWTLVLGW